MPVGRDFTAVTRKGSRLAGLEWFPASWLKQAAVAQQVPRLAQGAVPFKHGQLIQAEQLANWNYDFFPFPLMV